MDLKGRIESLRDEAVSIRRDLHRHPELAFREVRTSGIVSDYLGGLGLPVRTGIGKTGVTAVLEGGREGRTVLVRADMDALPIREANEVDYASSAPGVMHACGHDGHTTIGLMAARLLSEHRQEVPGRIVFAFQPAEEVGGGAKAMLKDGLLADPAPDRTLALHLWNRSPLGWVSATPGPALASADVFRIVLRGKGGHGAMPHLATDVVTAACHMVTAFQTVVSRSVDALQSAVVTVGTIRAGEAPNVIPDTVEMSGTIRTFERGVRDLVARRMEEIGRGVASAMNVEFEMALDESSPTTFNDPEVAGLVREVAVEMFGEENVATDFRLMGSEDMSFILERVPGCFVFLGSANESRGLSYPHHHPRFDFDEEALMLGAELLVRAAVRCLEAG